MRKWSIIQKIVITISTTVLLMSFVILSLFVSNEAREIEQNTINKIQILAEREAARVTGDFNIQVDKVKRQVLDFENFIEVGYINRLVASNMLRKVVEYNDLICSAWVVFEHNNFDGKDSQFTNSPEYDKSGRFVCWWHKLENDSLTLEPLPNFEQEDWYIGIYNNKGITLLEPYFYPLKSGKNQMFISVGSPIILKDSLLGITGNEMSLEHIQNLILGINVFEDDYACLISHSGIYAAHPITDKIGLKTGFEELNGAQKDKLEDGNTIIERHISEHLHKEVYDFYISVQINDIESPWYLRVSVPTDIVNRQVAGLRNKLIFLLLGIVLVILFILYIVLYFSIRPITKITNLISQLSSNGIDGAFAIKVKSNDEIGKLGESYNQLLNSLVEKRRIEIELESNQIKLKEKNEEYEAINEALSQSNDELQLNNIELINTKGKAEESELQLNLIADNFVNGMLYQVALLDENKRRFNYVSKVAEKLYGATPDEIMQNPDLIYGKVHPDDVAGLIAKEKVALQNMSVFETEARVVNADSSIRWAYFISKPRIINGVMCFDGIELDVTKRKQLEFDLIAGKEKAEESETKFKATFYTSPDAVSISTLNGEYVEINECFTRISGYTETEVLGKTSSEISIWAVPEDRGIFVATLKENDYVENFESLFRTKNGTTFPGLISARIITLKNKPYILAVTRNIAERKKYEVELLEAKEKAEESDRLKTEFINNMSHEIRTPMNGILGFSNFLNSENLSSERRKNYINIIINCGNQLMRIIDDILEISKLGTKQVKISEKEICLNDLLLEQFSIFDIKAKENKTPLYLKKGLSDFESTVLTDETKVNKILSNLLENALKFTDTGFIEFGYNLKSGSESAEVEIYVKDTGIGIKTESQQTIFERFSQEEKELSKNVGGLGLGLSIAKENAELLGGKITLQSQKGKGSTFFVTIPYRPVDSKNKKDNSNNEDNADKHPECTILIVEDEEVNYLYIEILFEDEITKNCNILHAKNGKDAVEICKDNVDIGLILMDLKMPIMNGFEATKLIKEYRPNLPIVAQTAYTTNEDKEKAILAGCDDFISKPISEKTLNAIINKYLIIK